jgi:hypothetical protein
MTENENAARVWQVEIPKGFWPPAQGCEERATLGKRRKKNYNRNAVVANVARDRRMEMAATALRLEIICGR